MTSSRARFRSALCALLFPGPGPAQELPLWELALGGGVLTIPEYRGSANRRTLPFPFIYPTYRGKVWRIDDDGVRGVLYSSQRTEFDFSADANTAVDSDASEARQGMPDLDPTVQIGPQLRIRLMTQPDRRRALYLNLPVRSVFEVNFDKFDHVGVTASPHFTYYNWFDLFKREWRMGLSAGLEFGDAEFHNFYYGVEPQFATETRPAYDAASGFGGTRFIASFISRTRKSWISFFARYDRLDGATFEDSPLVEQNGGLTVGFVYSRFLVRSKQTVPVNPVTNERQR
jgi:outer membrane scaffolding protein for murein synthesis (MipA/OmpV family)